MVIDLRSDTLTLPNREMLETALTAQLGDSGRLDSNSRGGDQTVNQLEEISCQITGKERAIFLPSGTMGNTVSLLTYCSPGENVLIDTMQHIYKTEKVCFSTRFGQLQPIFYHLTSNGYPDVIEIEKAFEENSIKLLCIENTHNSAGGTFIPLETLKAIRKVADKYGVPIHMDGARLFNASIASGLEVKEICTYADSVMFCLSKGLGAPVGSMLCGEHDFIVHAAATRKLMGGGMRQAGVIAAYGIYALQHQIPDLAEDHRRAKKCAELLRGMKHIKIPIEIQSNIIILNIEACDKTAAEVVQDVKALGVWMSVSNDTHARIVFCRNNTDEEVLKAASIIRSYDLSL